MTNPVPAPVDACVALVRWPCDAASRVRARATGTPRLLLIEPGTAPPSDCALDEDWTTTVAPPADVAARLAALATRPPRPQRLPSAVAAALDDAAIAVYDVLAERAPRPVPFESLAAAVGTADDLPAAVRRLRQALGTVDADVLMVTGGALLAAVQRTR
jgi:hypothetical protein